MLSTFWLGMIILLFDLSGWLGSLFFFLAPSLKAAMLGEEL